MSEDLERYMIGRVVDALENEKQPKITQYFIKAKQVNIAEKVSMGTNSEPLPDFDSMSDQELQERYDRAVAQHRHARAQTLKFLIKKRRGLRAR